MGGAEAGDEGEWGAGGGRRGPERDVVKVIPKERLRTDSARQVPELATL